MGDDILSGDLVAIAALIVGSIFAWSLGMGMGTGNGRHLMEQEAIARGYALYCPDTGVFAWNDECGGAE